jgi:hypothetical protein
MGHIDVKGLQHSTTGIPIITLTSKTAGFALSRILSASSSLEKLPIVPTVLYSGSIATYVVHSLLLMGVSDILSLSLMIASATSPFIFSN